MIPPTLDDEWMVKRAREAGVRPILTLTPLGEDGRFNNNLISILVQNPEVQERLIWELGRTVFEKKFGGVDVDFEYVLAEDGEKFAGFVKRLTQVMNMFGYQVSAALAPKISENQRGVLYEGIDYQLLRRNSAAWMWILNMF